MRDLTNTFTSKRQLVIPAEIRRKHGIQAGTKIKVLEETNLAGSCSNRLLTNTSTA
jgi:AbrB family looped-hinge helix DNA binding protein